MAFTQMYEQLPPDNIPLNIVVSFYPGIVLEATYDNLNDVFIVTASGLVIQAQFIYEWEVI
tara:strand:+ start:918 stop:1100 length:183 start_codon:yes stop_codon:yes gene_type:complete